jgi:hypothetical protein
METGMSDKNGCRSPDTHLLKFTASNKEISFRGGIVRIAKRLRNL